MNDNGPTQRAEKYMFFSRLQLKNTHNWIWWQLNN